MEDIWWRVEFQGRGSPHIHALIWIKDAPILSDIEQDKKPLLKDYMNKIIWTQVSGTEPKKDEERQHSSLSFAPKEPLDSENRQQDLSRVGNDFTCKLTYYSTADLGYSDTPLQSKMHQKREMQIQISQTAKK